MDLSHAWAVDWQEDKAGLGGTGHASVLSYLSLGPLQSREDGKGLVQAPVALKALPTWHRSLSLALMSPPVALAVHSHGIEISGEA